MDFGLKLFFLFKLVTLGDVNMALIWTEDSWQWALTELRECSGRLIGLEHFDFSFCIRAPIERALVGCVVLWTWMELCLGSRAAAVWDETEGADVYNRCRCADSLCRCAQDQFSWEHICCTLCWIWLRMPSDFSQFLVVSDQGFTQDLMKRWSFILASDFASRYSSYFL